MRYETISRLGRGGMGVVDLARDPDGNRVALKRLTLTGSASDIVRARARLLREADILTKLHHPNVVRLVDVLDEGDEIVLVMPYLPSGNLAERVTQHGPAPADEVERQARRLFGALAQAHRAGVIHRDIKPANILFDDRGEPCLADFGVAHSWDQTHGLTQSGMVVGTPGFMAPEQARGEPITPACDVFSLGATLLYAATGVGPFGAGEPGLLMVRAASGKVEKVPRELPGSLRRLLRSTLDPRPERRPLAAAIVGEPSSGLTGTVPAVRPPRGRTWAIAGSAAAAVALTSAALVLTGDDDDDGTPAGDGASVAADAAPCDDELPYQPCGQAEPAPFTDGSRCTEEHADYDGQAANGCEAEPDTLDETPLTDEVLATIVPRDDVDVYPLPLAAVAAPDGGVVVICDGVLTVTLVAPDGMALSLELRSDVMSLGEVEVPAASSAFVKVGPERCDPEVAGGTIEAVVRPVGSGRVADPYVLRVTGPE